LIPPLDPGACQLWWASTQADAPSLLQMLDEHERHRRERLVRRVDRALFSVSHGLARVVAAHHAGIAPRAITYADAPGAGKPRFDGAGAGLEFSISHSGSRAVLAISRGVRLGVDLERIRRDGTEASMIPSVLSAAEREELAATPTARKPWAFYRYWTRKEALLKATGDGLSVSPERISVTAPTDAPALLDWADPRRPLGLVHLYDLEPASGYCAALAALGSSLRSSDHDGDALLRASS
jgi:4'-phosphopantetheinyl transferase